MFWATKPVIIKIISSNQDITKRLTAGQAPKSLKQVLLDVLLGLSTQTFNLLLASA